MLYNEQIDPSTLPFLPPVLQSPPFVLLYPFTTKVLRSSPNQFFDHAPPGHHQSTTTFSRIPFFTQNFATMLLLRAITGAILAGAALAAAHSSQTSFHGTNKPQRMPMSPPSPLGSLKDVYTNKDLSAPFGFLLSWGPKRFITPLDQLRTCMTPHCWLPGHVERDKLTWHFPRL